MKTKKRFLNVVFNIKRNPEYKGNHELAPRHGRTDRIHTTFPLGTTEEEMVSEFHAELVNISNGKTWLKGEMIQVTSIDNCFEDSCDD